VFGDHGSDDIRLGRIAGVDVAASWGLVAVAALFTVTLAVGQYPRAFPGYGDGTYWLVALTATSLFIVSVLVHELGHAVIARGEGVGVEGVTLWMFGGVARLSELPATAASEARIALAGPSATGLAAGVFWLLAVLLDGGQRPSLLAAMFDWLSRTNLVLLALNLLPALPLDGGRVTSALLWHLTGSRRRGNVYAAWFGWVVGSGLVALGVLLAVDGRPQGLWALLVGWLVVSASRAENTHERLRHAWSGRTAGELRAPAPPIVEDRMSAEAAAQSLAVNPAAARHRLVPVRDGTGRTVGVLRAEALAAVPPERRRHLRVTDVADPLRDVPIVGEAADVDAVVEEHPEALDIGVLVAGHDGRLVGVLGPAQLLSVLRLDRPRAAAR
jgi:Zn-dependent protease